METAQLQKTENQRERMNNLYRIQRHFYDFTRRFFLLGRDELLEQLNAQPGERVLEVGCGTSRNLLELSREAPLTRLYGLDASDEMLKTAGAKLDAQNRQKHIILRQGLAEEFSFQETFGLNAPFDKMFISYSFSIIPAWRAALVNALANLKPGGDLYVVDFWDGAGLPAWFNRILRWWLALYRVYPRPEFLEFLKELTGAGEAGELTVSSIASRYAFIAHFRKVPDGIVAKSR